MRRRPRRPGSVVAAKSTELACACIAGMRSRVGRRLIVEASAAVTRIAASFRPWARRSATTPN